MPAQKEYHLTLQGDGDEVDMATLSLFFDSTGATLIIGIITSTAAVGAGPVLQDNQGNTYTALTPKAAGATAAEGRAQLFYCLNPNTDANHVMSTTSVASSFPAFVIASFSGVVAFDAEGGDASNIAAGFFGADITTAEVNELLIAGLVNSNAGSNVELLQCIPFDITKGLYGAVMGQHFLVAGVNYTTALAYANLPTPATYHPLFGWKAATGGQNPSVVLAAFKTTPLVTASPTAYAFAS